MSPADTEVVHPVADPCALFAEDRVGGEPPVILVVGG
jgi:hypothetical protein